MKYISALDMRFRATEQRGSRAVVIFSLRYCSILFFYCAVALLLYCSKSSAEIIDRVVAYIDDTAITLSELHDEHIKMGKNVVNITKQDVINSMINRILLIKEAKKMRLEASTDDEMIRDYIDIKIKSLIFIKEDEVKKFYNDHISDFRGREYRSVRDDIEKYLFELETNRQLKNHIAKLRDNAEIRMQAE
ncbi:MAG: hypothetical protein QMD01_02225 [Thermodesulfovibrionales bacterium]|nr:hypothetical protein [Thermodesulfovibrionales bacterium]